VAQAAAALAPAPETGGRIYALWPDPQAVAAVATGSESPVAVRVEVARAFREPVLLRLLPAPTEDWPATPPAPPETAAVFRVELFNLDGSIVPQHSTPLRVCAQVTDAQLAAVGGDLSRFAILRWNQGRERYERLPVAASDPATREVCADAVQTSTFVLAALPETMAGRPVADPRYFPETGYRISDDAIWDYFQRRGGLRAFGYPVSRQFRLMGTEVQFFQRRVLQRLPDGTVQQLNLLAGDLFPFRRINGSTFPAADPELLAVAPSPGDADYAARALAFVRQHVILGFESAYFSTVTCADAYPGQPCSDDTAALLNLEMWGLPISRPVLDPEQRTFAYQAFQRGILHYDFTTDRTEGILLADWWKALITGQGLPSDLELEAMSTPFWRQFDPKDTVTGMWWPDEVPDTNMVGAFAPDLPREEVDAQTLFGTTRTGRS
jgi:hypothetical protein